jgi:ribose transport system ATP-binding protein
VTVLRDGRVVASRPTAELDHDALIELIVGRAIGELYPGTPPTGTGVVLEVRGLWGDLVEHLDLVVHSGEIVGVAGLDGSGREELAGLLFGARHRADGHVIVDGRPLPPSPRAAIEGGVALVPADRKRFGSIANQSLRQNITIPRLGPLFRRGRLPRRVEQHEAQHWIDQVDVRPGEPERIFQTLSGGNQQKAVIARWLRTRPKLLVLDEPTQGVDVGAKATIYGLLAGAAANGAAIVVCSSDAEELATICDRVVVLRNGRISAELAGDELVTETIVQHILR